PRTVRVMGAAFTACSPLHRRSGDWGAVVTGSEAKEEPCRTRPSVVSAGHDGGTSERRIPQAAHPENTLRGRSTRRPVIDKWIPRSVREKRKADSVPKRLICCKWREVRNLRRSL